MAQSLSTGKIAEVIFENMLETYEHNTDMLDRVDYWKPDPATLQNARNRMWRPVQQHAPIIEGWDVSNQKQGVFEPVYLNSLGQPLNDIVELRADDMRDPLFWERRGKQSGMKQASELNYRIAQLIQRQSAHYYQSSSFSGFDFIGEAETRLNELEIANSGNRTFILSDADMEMFGEDLAERQTLEGRAEMPWNINSIGHRVANFDVYKASFLPIMTGGELGDPIVHPMGVINPRPINESAVEENDDYREQVITIRRNNDSGNDVPVNEIAVGDKITIDDVNAVSMLNKQKTGRLITFTVVNIANRVIDADNTVTDITVYPRPIMIQESTARAKTLSLAEEAFAIGANDLGGVGSDPATFGITRINTGIAMGKRANLFFEKDAIEVLGGTVPADLFRKYNGYKVIMDRMKNGQEVYMLFAGDIEKMTFCYRIFTWYGMTVRYPLACGVAVTF